MTVHYDILIRLGVYHDYFGGAITPAATITPSHKTKAMMRNYGFLAKMNAGKLDVGLEVFKDEQGSQIIDRLQGPMEFLFILQANDPHWSNYTDVLPDAGHVHYFSNLSTHTEEEVTYLHGASRVVAEDQIEFVIGDSIELDLAKQITLHRLAAQEIDCSYAIETIQDEEGKVVQKRLVMQHLDEGRYRLNTGGEERIFVHLKESKRVLGVVECFVDPSASEASPIVNADWYLQTTDFRIAFQNRKTVWRYLIQKNKLEHLEGLRITNGASESPFGTPEDTVGPDGSQRLLFTSKETLPLTAKPEHYLQLKKNMNTENKAESVVIDRLPTPNKENLYRVGEDGSILTDIFINL